MCMYIILDSRLFFDSGWKSNLIHLSGAHAKAWAPVALLRASDYSVILLRRFINAERLV
ncbi:MAG: hypothetical protein ACYTFK_13075 [Planctomycetota bacterium]|jgi:hypothetical protein